MNEGQKRPEFGRRNLPKPAAPTASPAASAPSSRRGKTAEGMKKNAMLAVAALSVGGAGLLGVMMFSGSDQPGPVAAVSAPVLAAPAAPVAQPAPVAAPMPVAPPPAATLQPALAAPPPAPLAAPPVLPGPRPPHPHGGLSQRRG
jgi:hypothetical protein